MKYIIYGLIIFVSTVLLVCTNREETVNTSDEQKEKNYTLVWQEEFNYTGPPDSTKWVYDLGDGCPDLCGWGNNELQHYTKRKENVRVENGILTIEILKEDYENSEYTSARLVTRGKHDWKYGRFEIRAKLPTHKGIWSAIWMMPTENKYGTWPKSGEIDIMENVGYDPDTVVTAAHTEAYYFTIGTHKQGRLYVPDNDTAFHTYVLEWEEDQFKVSVDDVEFFTFPNEGKGYMEWPFDQRFYMILNIAYGGNWGGAQGLEPDKLPQKMEIDYIRIYQEVQENDM